MGGGEEKTRDGGHGWEVTTGRGDKISKLGSVMKGQMWSTLQGKT